MKEKLQQFETQIHTLAEAIQIKDKELTLIREGSTELSKQILHQHQLTDRLQHYEAQEHTLSALKAELDDAKNEIQQLVKENGWLKEERMRMKRVAQNADSCSHDHNHDHSHDHDAHNHDGHNHEGHDHEGHDHGSHDHGHSHDHNHTQDHKQSKSHNHEKHGHEHDDNDCNHHHDHEHNQTKKGENYHQVTDDIEDYKKQIEELKRSNELLKMELSASQVNHTDKEKEIISENSVRALDKEAAMKQLEIKFKKTMEDIATLQDEKQRLEHVVLQLQGETETIGEYIALYQHQRAVLKQRSVDKENQLKQLASDREQMRFKLEQLNSLVRRLMQEKGAIPADILEQHRKINEDAQESERGRAEVNVETNNNTNETAEQIIALLSEIKTSNLVQPSGSTENFHPCPCCSGLLLNV